MEYCTQSNHINVCYIRITAIVKSRKITHFCDAEFDCNLEQQSRYYSVDLAEKYSKFYSTPNLMWTPGSN